MKPKFASGRLLHSAGVILLIALTVPGFAQEAGSAAQPPKTEHPAGSTGTPTTDGTSNQGTPAGGAEKLALSAADLQKTGFAAGVAIIYMGKKGIENASVDANGIVRVDELSQARAGAILEYHFYWADRRKTRLSSGEASEAGFKGAGFGKDAITVGSARWDLVHGPAFAVEFGENFVRSAGLGYQWSLRDYTLVTENDKKVIKTVGTPFNVGLFLLVEPNVKVLGNGLKANAPLPTGDALRFEKEAHIGGALVLSYSF